MPQPAPISSVLLIRFGSIALMLRMKNSELEFGQRVIDPRRHVDDEPVGVDSLRDRLAAHQRRMGRGDVELGRVHQTRHAKLAKDGLPRAHPIFNIHGVSPLLSPGAIPPPFRPVTGRPKASRGR